MHPKRTGDSVPDVDRPGLRNVRETVAHAERRLARRGAVRQGGLAGLNSAVASVPDGMASGVLAGVNPFTACTPVRLGRSSAASSPAPG